jgi:alanyl aminopeptidase
VIPLALKDPSRHLVSATASLVGKTTADIVPDELRPRLARFIRDTYGERARALGWKAKPGEDEDTRLLRRSLVGLVATRGEDRALGAEAVELARRWLDDPRAIDPDMLNVALGAAARNGDRALFERFRDEARASKDRLRRQRLLGAIGAFRDPAIAQDAFKLALDDALDPRESLSVVFGAGGGEPKIRRMSYEFLKAHLDPIVARLPREILGYLPFAAAASATRRCGRTWTASSARESRLRRGAAEPGPGPRGHRPVHRLQGRAAGERGAFPREVLIATKAAPRFRRAPSPAPAGRHGGGRDGTRSRPGRGAGSRRGSA